MPMPADDALRHSHTRTAGAVQGAVHVYSLPATPMRELSEITLLASFTFPLADSHHFGTVVRYSSGWLCVAANAAVTCTACTSMPQYLVHCYQYDGAVGDRKSVV